MADIIPIKPPTVGTPTSQSLKSGGGGGTFDGMEACVKTLEDDMKEIRKDLRTLVIDSAEIRGMLKSMPSPSVIGELNGRVDSLPTVPKIAAMLGIAVAVMTILNNWSDLIDKLFR